MSFEAYGHAVIAGNVLSAAAAAATLVIAAKGWRKDRNPIDLAYAAAMVAWLLYLLVANNAKAGNAPSLALFASYQVIVVVVAFFLLVSASVVRLRVHAIWMIQGSVGLLLILAWKLVPASPVSLPAFWLGLNIICSSAITLYLGVNLYREGSYRCWLVFGGSILGLGIFFQDVVVAAYPANNPAQYFYAFFLLVLWLLLTNRAGHPEPAAVLPTGAAHSAWENFTGFFPDTDFSAPAISNERRRIAQELHDGVASQLVNVLATLDMREPGQRAVALALEQCLLDLKIMVDSIDSTEGSVLDALGRLRYRVQHALDKMGISMAWKVDIDGPLLAFSGERAQQILRITQECLSNVMRHAGATAVTVVCHYQPESHTLLLEVHDNGRGIPVALPGQPMGKGLSGLRRRSESLGGKLEIATKAKKGTLVRLQVPLEKPVACNNFSSSKTAPRSMPHPGTKAGWLVAGLQTLRYRGFRPVDTKVAGLRADENEFMNTSVSN